MKRIKNKTLTKNLFGIFIMMQVACSTNPINGIWQYDGGIYNGKAQKASPDFKMQRTYTNDKYDAYLIEEGTQPEKYGSGRYEIKDNNFLVTSEFSSQPSQLTGKTIAYKFEIDDDKLTLKGTLPNGMQVEEYWKKMK